VIAIDLIFISQIALRCEVQEETNPAVLCSQGLLATTTKPSPSAVPTCVLPEHFQARVGIGIAHMFLGHPQHSAGATVGLIELGNLLLEVEVLEYLPRLGRETLDVNAMGSARPCPVRP